MKRFTLFFLIAVAAFITGFFWWQRGLSAVNKNDKSQTVVVIKKGEGIREIANDLQSKHLINDPIVFFLRVKQLGLDGKIQAGDHRISPSMSATEIAQSLTKGSIDVWVTIPEGLRAEEIATILQNNIPTYQEDWPEILSQHEGYLFPDTYLVPRNTTVNQIVNLLRNNFDQKYASLGNASIGLSQKEIITIASLIEREAKHDQDRPLVASVILNRLDIGMKLDIDATLQYMLGYQPQEKRWWKRSVTNQDKSINSPYNTYRNAGLPPTPISNPGLASMQAVVNPAQTNYLYYVSDAQGFNHYAETFKQHEANIAKYL